MQVTFDDNMHTNMCYFIYALPEWCQAFIIEVIVPSG